MFIWIAVIIGTVLLDQLTKYLTILYLKPVGSVPIIQDVLHLTYVENTGAAFGMMKDQRWLFMTTSVVAIVVVLVYLFVKKPASRWECLALSFIVGGGIGNMIDRILLEYVVDMIDFCLINFAVFNVADSFVCIGVGLMMLVLVRAMIQESKAAKAAAATETLATEADAALAVSEADAAETAPETAAEVTESEAVAEAAPNVSAASSDEEPTHD